MTTKTLLLFTTLIATILCACEPSSDKSFTEEQENLVQNQLLADDESTRGKALISLQQERSRQAGQVRSFMFGQDPPPSSIGFGSRDHVLLSAITVLNMNEAIVPLVDWLAVDIDPATVPVGAKMHPSGLYPAASAIVELGGSHLAPMMIDKIGQQVDTKTRKLAVWVMVNSYGEEITLLLLERALESERNEFRIEGLQESLRLMEDVDGLLVMESPN